MSDLASDLENPSAREWPTLRAARPVEWKDIVNGVYYGGGGAYLYQPIAKCACTTIKTLLIELEGLPVHENQWRRHKKEFNKFPGTEHLSVQENLDIFEGRTNTFKFVFIRNPYARLASAYAHKILWAKQHWREKVRRSALSQGIALSCTISFEEFVRVVSQQSFEEMDDHWRPQYHQGRFQVIKYDFIGHLEMMPDDLVYVLERIGAPESIIRRAGEKYNFTGASLELWETVSPAVRKQYLDTFGIDFDSLHYARRLPMKH